MKKTTGLLTLVVLAMLAAASLAETYTQYIPALGQSFPFAGIRVVEPADDLALDTLNPDDFGIPQTHTPSEPSYLLMAGTQAETPVYTLDSGQPGPRVYLMAGTHGDERAGWYAAEMLKNLKLESGVLTVLPQANRPGCRQLERHVVGSLDLNRAYPGSPEGDIAQRLAYDIQQDIARIQPTLVLDLHEAAVYAQGRDFLGNTVIYTVLDGIEELFFHMLTAFEDGQLGAHPFTFVSPGERGSLNDVLPRTLSIPVLTVETFRGYPLSVRVGDQVDIVLYCLRYYGMVQ